MSRSRLASGLMVFSLCLAGARSVSAQNNGNPSILQAVQQLQRSVDTLQSSVNSVETNVTGIGAIGVAVTALQSALKVLQTSVDGLSSESQSNVRVTPPVNVAGPDLAACGLVNISSQTRTVKVEIFDFSGALAEGPFTFPYPPGTGNLIGNRSASLFYCRFTVIDGVKADIRAGMSVCSHTECKQTIPAE